MAANLAGEDVFLLTKAALLSVFYALLTFL
jgi:hypothetical protein